MNLLTEMIVPFVESWFAESQALKPFENTAKWTEKDVLLVSKDLASLSNIVTPTIVKDVDIAEVELHEILLSRAVKRIEDALVHVAGNLRQELQYDPFVELRYRGLLGLRSASYEELEALPGVGEVLARDIAQYLAENPEINDINALEDIDGVGPERIAQLRETSYLDRPHSHIISPTIWRFMKNPRLPLFIDVLENTDIQFVYGDQHTVERRFGDVASGEKHGSAYRLGAFIQTISKHLESRTSRVDGTTVSELLAVNERHSKRNQYLSTASEQQVTSRVLIGGRYVSEVKKVIDQAKDSLSLMVFLGTTSAGKDDGPGPLELIEALEAAASRQVDVKVILDKDDIDAPYKSYWINRPLIKRLQNAGIQARFDEKDTLLHSKVLVVDRDVAVVGSHNWTRAGFNDSYEASVLMQGSTLAESFAQRFDDVWETLAA